jgi:RNA polymerase Rpb1, domain 5
VPHNSRVHNAYIMDGFYPDPCKGKTWADIMSDEEDDEAAGLSLAWANQPQHGGITRDTNNHTWADVVRDSHVLEDHMHGYAAGLYPSPFVPEPLRGREGGIDSRSWVDIVRHNLPALEEHEYEWDRIGEEQQPVSLLEAQTIAQESPGGTVRTDHALTQGQWSTYVMDRYGSWADAVKHNLPPSQGPVDESEYHEHTLTGARAKAVNQAKQPISFPGDPVGIRVIQSILMSATQTNLSHFHTAGMGHNVAGKQSPSAADAMDSVYTTSNTSMTFQSSDNAYTLRKALVGASMMHFVSCIGCNIVGFPDKENVWYEAAGKPMYKGDVLRVYVDYNKMRNHGLTLKDLASTCFIDDRTMVSPDFMGMIDVEVPSNQQPNQQMSQWLCMMGERVCGSYRIRTCDKVDSHTAVTVGSDVLAVSRVNSVDTRTIRSNNVTEMEEHYGIEAAACVLQELTGSHIVSDFMTRTGRVLAFTKNSIEVVNKGILTSMGFERPRDDIRRALIGKGANTTSVYESIITGAKIDGSFDILTPFFSSNQGLGQGSHVRQNKAITPVA